MHVNYLNHKKKKTRKIFPTYLSNTKDDNKSVYIYCGITFKDMPIDGNESMFESKADNCLGVILNVGINSFAGFCGGLFQSIDNFWCAYLSQLDIQSQYIDEDSNKKMKKKLFAKKTTQMTQ